MSVKKLEKEGAWETRKEILGWILDGINRTMELPKKNGNYRQGDHNIFAKRLHHTQGSETHQRKNKACSTRNVLGKRFVFTYKQGTRSWSENAQIGKESPLRMALQDTRTMAKLVAREPTRLSQVMPQCPDIVVFVDASKEVAGGTVY